MHFEASQTEIVSPTYVPDLVNATLDLLIDGEGGLWHLANRGQLSWYDFALMLAKEAEIEPRGLVPTTAPISRVTALTSCRGAIMPTIESSVRRYISESEISWRSSLKHK
jgi:dTDP-4-dehydrorhamnose reductase